MAIDDVEVRLSSFEERVKRLEGEGDQVRAAYGRIMALREAGHTVRAIWEDLRDGGLQMTHAGFKSALRRAALESKRAQPSSFADAFDSVPMPKGNRTRWK